jgi:hypothetical protein
MVYASVNTPLWSLIYATIQCFPCEWPMQGIKQRFELEQLTLLRTCFIWK